MCDCKMLGNRFADKDFSGQARYQERCLQLVTQANFVFATTTVSHRVRKYRM